jgi:protein-disulfide isomerase
MRRSALMSDQNNSQPKNNPVAIILIVVALLAVIGGAYFYMNGKKSDSSTLIAEGTEQVAPSDETNSVEDEVVSEEDGDSTSSVTSEKVTLDVSEIMAPRVIGDANAPVKVIEFASLTCSHCAHFHNEILPKLKEKYIDTGKVQFEFREFPLNDPALKAAITARCLPVERYENFVGLLFKTQDKWAGGLDYMSALKQNAKLAGLSDARFDACHNNPEIKTNMALNMQAAQEKWKISSTPSFIVNDTEVITGAVGVQEFERVFRKVTNNAVGEAPAVE